MVVADSSVLIPLLRIGRISLLKSLFGRIIISREVCQELRTGINGLSVFEEACKSWIKVFEKSLPLALEIAKRECIEKADASLILLAEDKKEILLSNDAAMILVAWSRGIECWWMTTFIIKCIKKKIIDKKEAKKIIIQLIQSGMHLDNVVYATLLDEIERI